MFVTARQRSFAFEAKTSLTLTCLRVSIAITEHHFHKRLGKERVYFILLLTVHHPGRSGQEPGGRR